MNFLIPVRFAFMILSILVISSCGTSYLTLSVTEPAPVSIPADVQNVGIFNRSIPSTKESSTLDDIDKILTAEGKNLDKDGALAAIDGLAGRLEVEERFITIKLIDSTSASVEGQGGTIYPSEINGETIDQICQENDIELLFVLSYYDTDSRVEADMVPVTVDVPFVGDVKAMEYQATITTLIKLEDI